MAFDVKQWLSSVKTEYPNLEVPKEAEEGWMRQSDYDKKFNSMKQEYQQRVAVEDDFHNRLVQSENKLKLVNQLEANYGPVENWSDTLKSAVSAQHPELMQNTRVPALKDFQSMLEEHTAPLRQELNEARQQIEAVGRGSAVLIEFSASAPDLWRDKFGANAKFPKKEFADFFEKSGTRDPFLAYELFEKPHYEKYQSEKHAEDLEKARTEGYQSAMSKHGITEVPVNRQSGMFFKGGEQKVDPVTGQSQQQQQQEPSYEERKARVGKAFVDALDKAERSGTGT